MPLLQGASALLQMPSFWQVGPGVGDRELCLGPTDAELCASLDLVKDPEVRVCAI